MSSSSSLSRLPLPLADAKTMRVSERGEIMPTLLTRAWLTLKRKNVVLCKKSCLPNAAHPIGSCVHSSPWNYEAGVTESDKDAITRAHTCMSDVGPGQKLNLQGG